MTQAMDGPEGKEWALFTMEEDFQQMIEHKVLPSCIVLEEEHNQMIKHKVLPSCTSTSWRCSKGF